MESGERAGLDAKARPALLQYPTTLKTVRREL